jgi:hypothetical protein
VCTYEKEEMPLPERKYHTRAATHERPRAKTERVEDGCSTMPPGKEKEISTPEYKGRKDITNMTSILRDAREAISGIAKGYAGAGISDL